MKKLLLVLTLSIPLLVASQNSFGDLEPMPLTLKGDIFYIKSGTEKLPDLNTLESVGSIYTDELDIHPRDFKEGFPGVTDRFEWFALKYTGEFQLQTSGLFLFELISDDGSKLFIDNFLVIDNDGQHSTSSERSEIKLDTGFHKIEIWYFQGPKFEVSLGLFFAYEDNPLMPFSIARAKEIKPILKIQKPKDISIYFEFDEFKTQIKLEEELFKLLNYIDKNDNFNLKLTGFTDSKGSEEYNLKLAERRVNYVKDYLTSKNPELKNRLSIVVKGELDEEKTEEQQALNRRVSIELIENR